MRLWSNGNGECKCSCIYTCKGNPLKEPEDKARPKRFYYEITDKDEDRKSMHPNSIILFAGYLTSAWPTMSLKKRDEAAYIPTSIPISASFEPALKRNIGRVGISAKTALIKVKDVKNTRTKSRVNIFFIVYCGRHSSLSIGSLGQDI